MQEYYRLNTNMIQTQTYTEIRREIKEWNKLDQKRAL